MKVYLINHAILISKMEVHHGKNIGKRHGNLIAELDPFWLLPDCRS